MRAPARVPHEMITESFHHMPSGRSLIIRADVTNVSAMETTEVIHTRLVSGFSKSISAALE